VIVDGGLVPANLSDLAMAEDLLANVAGWVLADRSWGSAQLADQGGWLLAPARGQRFAAAATTVADRQASPGRDRHRPADRPLPPQTRLGP
jgi:hypothetical protein